MKRLLFLLVVTLVSVSPVGPAHAKGPTDVIVSGPGIDGVVLTDTRRSGDVDAWALAEASSLLQIWGSAQAADRPPLTRAELGPRYELTWYVLGSVMARTRAYPFADGGAWAHVPGEMRSWVRGGPDLERALVELGAERPEAGAEAGVSTSSTAVGSGSPTEVEAGETSSRVAGLAWLSGLAGLVALGGVTAWWLRRRGTPQPG